MNALPQRSFSRRAGESQGTEEAKMLRLPILATVLFAATACGAASPDLTSRRSETRTADGKTLVVHHSEARAIAAADLAVNLSEMPGSRISEAQEQSLRQGDGTGWSQKVGLLPGKRAWAWASGWDKPYLFHRAYANSVGERNYLRRWLQKRHPLRFLGRIYSYSSSVPIEKEGRTGWVHTMRHGGENCALGEVLFLSDPALARNGSFPSYDTRVFIADCAGIWTAAEIKRFLENARRVPKRSDRSPAS